MEMDVRTVRPDARHWLAGAVALTLVLVIFFVGVFG